MTGSTAGGCRFRITAIPSLVILMVWYVKPEVSSRRAVTSIWKRDKHIDDPDSKVHVANMGPIWGRQDPGGPHVGPMNLLSGELKQERFTQLYTIHNFFAHKYTLKYINGRMIQLACFSKPHLSQRKYQHAGWMSELLGLTTLLEHQISYQCKCNNKLYIGIVIFAHVDNTLCSLLLT